MDKIRILSPAKINLDLIVGNKRKDGFHNISSLMQPINLYDEISIRISSSKNLIDLNFPEKLVKYEENIIVKAAESFFNYFKIANRVEISVKKRIPIGSGMGGGSSNAAATLIALSKLFNIDEFPALEKIALELGSDVPFFLYSRTSRVSGRGEVVKPFNINEKMKYILILPGIESNTKNLYEMWDKEECRNTARNREDIQSHLEKQILINSNKFILRNDFTPILLLKDKKYLNIFEILRDLNLNSYSVSGTGSTIFCVIDKDSDFVESQKYIESNEDLITLNVESFEGWHFAFD
ncbi:4-(cytidine 5'-diphospho)-2-C-methyl-D-erythritol kinase [bacterium]|nr:4-(cytidine 5'-diphospho)-2-C-methyl-D-erythritol kinase [bacterium]|tara:strand:+ start:21803 stop:22687 length:885 start_codon:yes stop_codon:yes gene_type:complete